MQTYLGRGCVQEPGPPPAPAQAMNMQFQIKLRIFRTSSMAISPLLRD